jgi:hypothetical protein
MHLSITTNDFATKRKGLSALRRDAASRLSHCLGRTAPLIITTHHAQMGAA